MDGCATWTLTAVGVSRQLLGLAPEKGIVLVVGLLMAGSLAPGVVWAQERDVAVERQVERSFHGTEGQEKEGAMVKVGEDLIRLYHEHAQHRAKNTAEPFSPSQTLLPVLDGRWVIVEAVAKGSPEGLRGRLEELGLRRGSVEGRLVSGLMPIEALKEMAELEALLEARPSMVSTSIGATTSQGDMSLRTDSLRDVSILTGEGVKIGVLSDSYDNHSSIPTTRAVDDIESGDLPGPGNPYDYTTPVEVLSELEDNTRTYLADEGRAMMQIIHDVAPGAELAFHTAFAGLANFAQGIRDLSNAGSEVIVDDVFYFTEPFFQDGLISQAIQEVVDDGRIYVTSAGNAGAEAYDSEFRGSGQNVPAQLEGDGELHDFDPGSTTDPRQRITLSAGQTLILTLQWDDPYASVSTESPGTDTDLDIYLLDDTSVVARGMNDNVGDGPTGGDPVEVIAIANNNPSSVQLDLLIALEQGPAPERLKYAIFQGGRIEEYRTNSPTLSGHSKSDEAISVAAAAWFNTPHVTTGSGEDPPLLNAFSSKGGTPVLFDSDGDRLQDPGPRDKPDLTGPDGVNTTFFGFNIQQDQDDDPNFFGTSAAAPHIAAIAALMREAQPNVSSQVVREQLKSSSIDIVERYSLSSGQRGDIPNGEGFDYFSGSGLVRAGEAVLPLLPVQVANLQGQHLGNQEKVHLDWATVKETNSRQFIVEYHPGQRQQDPDAKGWRHAGTVASSAEDGESIDTLLYNFRSAVPSPGRYVFRLRHEQQDGKTQRVGPQIEVNVPFEGTFEIGGPQPNPTRGEAEVQLVVEETQEVRLDLYDMLGRRIRTIYNGPLAAERPLLRQIDVQDLASGTYFFRVIGENFDVTRRLVRIR